jgi:ZIP family zinc transporter
VIPVEAPQSLWFALALTLAAGLTTGLGGAFALVSHSSHRRLLGAGLGLSGGVMVYISFVELLPKASELLGESLGGTWTVIGFFSGMATMAVIDALVPERSNPHDAVHVEDRESIGERSKLERMGMMTAVAIAIHNFPEGLATFYSGLHDPTVGVSVAAAIGLHNIPEGIAVALPIFHATHNRARAFGHSLLSGLAEPLGAVLGWLTIGWAFDDGGMGLIFAAVAGIMVFLALDQLIPNAKRYASGHESVYGLIGGMLIMALALAWL